MVQLQGLASPSNVEWHGGSRNLRLAKFGCDEPLFSFERDVMNLKKDSSSGDPRPKWNEGLRN